MVINLVNVEQTKIFVGANRDVSLICVVDRNIYDFTPLRINVDNQAGNLVSMKLGLVDIL